MKITPSDNDSGRRVLQIEAAWDEIESDYSDIVHKYSQVRLPGFRPGKVSRTVIEQRFRKEIVEDLSQRAAERLGREAIRQSGVESLGPVEATDIECEKGRPFRFIARYFPMLEINLPDLGSLMTDAGDDDPRDLISLRLLELVKFDIPDVLVQEELAFDGTDGAETGDTEWKAAAERIRLMLILKMIATTEGIEVDETDVAQRIKEKAVDFNSNPDTLRAELEKGGGLKRLKDMLVAESTLEYLMEKTRE